MSLQLAVRLDAELYRPGDPVTGTIEVREGGSSRTLEALLEYVEETEDYSSVATSIASGPLHTGELTTGMSFAFALALPADALPNFGGRHGKLYWQVDAKADKRGRDAHERCRIRVDSAQRP